MNPHSTTFLQSDFPFSLRPLWNQFTTELKNYLSILYLFTYSDHKTVLTPIVCAPSYHRLLVEN